MKKQKSSQNKTSFSIMGRLKASTFLFLLVVSILAGFYAFPVLADKYDDQIKALRQQNASYEARAAELRILAGSLAEEIARLEAEKQAILVQIADNDKKLTQLNNDIKKTEAEILANQDALGLVIKDMYFADQISPLERLASSKTISDYINEETHRDSMRRNLIDKVDEIEANKKALETQKKEVEAVLERQKAQRDNLVAKEAAKNKILSDTKGEENNYRQMAEKNNAKVKQLEAAQAEEMRRLAQQGGWNVPGGTVGGGGYPGKWAFAPLNSYVDSWGMFSRQCVSYAAWKVWSTGRRMPYWGGDRYVTIDGRRVFTSGHAKYWPINARADGIPTGSTPKEGAVAVWYIGYYGHVMYVEKLNGDGTMWVSDYNWNWDGAYHYYKRSTAGLTYIYF